MAAQKKPEKQTGTFQTLLRRLALGEESENPKIAENKTKKKTKKKTRSKTVSAKEKTKKKSRRKKNIAETKILPFDEAALSSEDPAATATEVPELSLLPAVLPGARDKTEIFELTQARSKLIKDLKFREKQLEVEKMEVAGHSDDEIQKNQTSRSLGVSEIYENLKKKPFNRRRFLLLLLLFVIVWFYQGKEEVSQFQELNISAVNFSETEDKLRAKKFLEQGLEIFSENRSFQKLLQAAALFKKSVFFQSSNNPASSYLLLAYAESLKHVVDEKAYRENIAEMIRLFEFQNGREKVDLIAAQAKARFFYEIGRYSSSEYVIERYILLHKPNLNLFSLKMLNAIEIGRLDSAEKIFKTIRQQKERTSLTHLAIIRFYKEVQDNKLWRTSILDASRIYPADLSFQIEKIRFGIEQADVSFLESAMKVMEEKKFGGSKFNYSIYLLAKSYLAISKNDFKDAQSLIQESLKIRENKFLRSSLAKLPLEGPAPLQSMIKKSRALGALEEGKTQLERGLLRHAFSKALTAVELVPRYLPAQIFLTQVQKEQGFYSDAIETLKGLSLSGPLEFSVQSQLVRTYIESRKFAEAKLLIQKLDGSDFSQSHELMYLKGLFFETMNSPVEAVKWFRRAALKAPHIDKYFASLAEVLSKNGRHDLAKRAIGKAIELNPGIFNYHAVYARSLFDLEDDQAAIGYLKDVLRTQPDQKELLSQLAIFYHRSGQIQQFEETKNRLEKLYEGTLSLYLFLYKVALLQENYEQAVVLVDKILDLRPGRLDFAMKAGEILLELGNKDKALKYFLYIKSRQPSYPKLYVHIARIYLQSNKLDKAEEKARQEVEQNPEEESGHLVLGEILLLKEDYKLAAESFKKALEFNPSSTDALLGMAEIQMIRHRYGVAIDLFLKVREKKPQYYDVLRRIGHAYRKLGQGTMAIEFYREYLEKSASQKERKQIEDYIKILK